MSYLQQRHQGVLSLPKLVPNSGSKGLGALCGRNHGPTHKRIHMTPTPPNRNRQRRRRLLEERREDHDPGERGRAVQGMHSPARRSSGRLLHGSVPGTHEHHPAPRKEDEVGMKLVCSKPCFLSRLSQQVDRRDFACSASKGRLLPRSQHGRRKRMANAVLWRWEEGEEGL